MITSCRPTRILHRVPPPQLESNHPSRRASSVSTTAHHLHVRHAPPLLPRARHLSLAMQLSRLHTSVVSLLFVSLSSCLSSSRFSHFFSVADDVRVSQNGRAWLTLAHTNTRPVMRLSVSRNAQPCLIAFYYTHISILAPPYTILSRVFLPSWIAVLRQFFFREFLAIFLVLCKENVLLRASRAWKKIPSNSFRILNSCLRAYSAYDFVHRQAIGGIVTPLPFVNHPSYTTRWLRRDNCGSSVFFSFWFIFFRRKIWFRVFFISCKFCAFVNFLHFFQNFFSRLSVILPLFWSVFSTIFSFQFYSLVISSGFFFGFPHFSFAYKCAVLLVERFFGLVINLLRQRLRRRPSCRSHPGWVKTFFAREVW